GGDPQRLMDAQLILTLGLSLIITNGTTMLLTPMPRGIKTAYATQAFAIGPVLLNQARSYAFLMALALAGVVYVFLTRPDLRKALRAAADDPEAAGYQGIDVRAMHGLAFGVGIALVAAAGGLLATYHPIEPTVAVNFIVLMFVAVVLGGHGSIPGAFAGGLLIGLVQSLTLLVLPLQLQNVGVFLTFLLVVTAGRAPWIWMPAGMVAAVVAAVLIGLPTFRLAGIYFALATLAYPLIFRIVMVFLGYQEVPIPMIRDRPAAYMQFRDPRAYDLLALAALGGTLLLSHWI